MEPRCFLSTAATCVLLLGSAACGSTVSPSQQLGAGQSGAATGLGQMGASSAGSGTSSLGSAGAAGVSGAAPLAGSAAGAPAGSLPAGSQGPLSPSGQTSSDKKSQIAASAPIAVGLLADDYSGIAKQFGVALPSNYFQPYDHFFAYLNKHGGLGGHQVKAVHYTVNGAAASASTEAQAACTSLAEDSKVQVVLSYAYANPDFSACLATHGIMQIDDSQFATTDGDLAKLTNYLSPDGVTLDREAPLVIAGMHATGYLTAQSKVGVLHGGCSDETKAYKDTMPALAKQYGFTLLDHQLTCYTGDAALGQATSDIQSAVLKFRSAGVDRVFALSGFEGYILDQFTAAARNQNYAPGYFVTSNGNTSANADSSNSAGYTPDALQRMHGVSWRPLIDLGNRAPTTARSKQGQSACRAMDPTMGGATAGSSYYLQLDFFYSDCDDVRLLQQMVTRTGGNLGVRQLRAAYQTVGSPLIAAATYAGLISSSGGRQDGIDQLQNISFKSSCSCFTADGPSYRANT
jgi:hypothetical protein